MNEIKIFDNQDFGQVRIVMDGDKPLFCGTDVARALGYSIPSKAVNTHCKGVSKMEAPTNGGIQKLLFISEGDVYRLVVHSKLPAAEKFERWVFDEVLPSIRKHGIYATDVTVDRIISDPDFGIQLLMQLKDERSKRAALENTVAVQSQQIAEMSPQASYYDLILQSQGAVSISKIAKDYGKSAIWMNQKLSELGVQYYQGHMWLLYQKYAEQGYTQSKSYPIVRKDGTNDCVMNTCWTQKGRLFLYELLKRNGILPLIEKVELSA